MPKKDTPSCASCRYNATCTKRKKAPDYWCEDYKIDALSTMLAFGAEPTSKSSKIITLNKSLDLSSSSFYDPSPFDIKKFDVEAIINEAVTSNNQVTSDLKIPERDHPAAVNFYEFTVGEDFLNAKPFVKQMEIAIKLFAEWCPRCTDTDYFVNGGIKVTDSLKKFKKKVALLEHGVCPHCHARKSQLVADEELNLYEEMAIMAGQRGGKSALTAMMFAYITHRVIKMQRMVDIYGMLSNTTMVITFTAITMGQVKLSLWDPYYGYITEAPWFQNYHKMLDEYKAKTGEELYRIKDTFILYRHRKLLTMIATPDVNKMRGATRLAASIDEIGRFDNSTGNNKIKMNAGGVYEALQRSLRTVRSAARRVFEHGLDNALPGYFLNISSPSNYRDKISSLVRESVGSRKLLGYQLPTWEMNPKVTREDLDDEFRRDPAGAMCDYGAQPPLTSNPFIASETAVTQNFNKSTNPIRIQYAKSKRKDGTATIFAYPTKLKNNGRPSVLAIDAGYSNNSFAMVGGSLDENDKPCLDLFVEVMPRAGIPLNHSKIYTDLIKPIIDERNCKLVSADQWQSIKILQDIEEEFEIAVRKYSLKYTDLVMFKDYILDREIEYPHPKWEIEEITKHDSSEYPLIFKNNAVEHFVLQCLTVQDTGSQVIKGENLTDDLWRAAVLCGTMLVAEENYEILHTEERRSNQTPIIGLFQGLSGVSGNANIHTTATNMGTESSPIMGVIRRRG